MKRKRDIMQENAKIRNMSSATSNKVIITSDLWKTVISITMGIESSVNSTENITELESLSLKDYDLKNTFELYNPSLDDYSRTEFIDYAPKVFTLIRNLNQITKESYLKSLGTECLKSILAGSLKTFKGIASAGKSGSFFFTSSDDKYLVKTIPQREFTVALKILKNFSDFINSKNDEKGQSQSLIAKIYGLHKIKFFKSGRLEKELSIVVMENLFENGIELQCTYDLKGSWFRRFTR